MTFASAERAYLTPPEGHECELDDCQCEERAADAYQDAMEARAEDSRDGDDW